MLTVKQHELLSFIHDRLAATGVSPSFDEMREALDLKSKSGVHRLISALEERQFIRRLPNRARALEVVKMPEVSTPASAARPLITPANDTIEIPMHGRIAAGTPIEALCGHVWVPSRDPRQLPVCQACKDIYEMYRGFNDGLNETPGD